MTTPVHRRPPTLVLTAGSNPVAGGSQAGWISGDVSGLAPSASVMCIFDLGPEWDQYPLMALHVFPSGGSPSTFSGFTNIQGSCADTPGYNAAKRLMGNMTSASSGAIFSAGPLTPANGDYPYLCRVCGRYVTVQVTNGDAVNTAGAASKLTVVAYTG